MNQKVLIYSPFGTWYLHTLYEITIAHALRLRGAEVKFLCCDALYSDCDVHWENTLPRHDQSCRVCMNTHTKVFENLKMPFEWLGQYLPDKTDTSARQWVNNLDNSGLFDAAYDGYPLGRWVKSSVHSHFRMNELDISDKKINKAYRSYLYSAVIALNSLRRVFETYKPDILFMLNGRFFSHRVAVELAKEHSVRILIHERGRIDNSLTLWENESSHNYNTFLKSWNEWKEMPLIQRQLNDISKIFAGREHGKNTGWKSYASGKQKISRLVGKLGLSPDKKIITLFTSSDDETAASEGWKGIIDQFEWIARTIEYVRRKNEYELIIRIHPNTSGILGSNDQFLGKINQLITSGLPETVKIVMPDKKINSYQLINISRACLVHTSTISLEAAIRGKPVLMCGGGIFYGHDFTLNLPDADKYEAYLEKLLAEEISTEKMCLAYRFGFHHFIRMSIPFPLVSVINVHHANINYKTLDSLLPGKDSSLDRVCVSVLFNEPIYPAPESGNEAAPDDENCFLHQKIKEIESSGHEIEAASKPLVSVIIPCYNYARYLSDAVESVIAQTYQEFEIIIVNDGSTDNSREVAEQMVSVYPDHRIQLINQTNSGQPAISRNRGISEAKGEYILCLDADDMIDPAMLEECLDLLESDESIAVAYTDRRDFDGVNQIVRAGNYDFSGLKYANHISYCALMRREVWEKVGGYRTNVKGVEDWDFWIAAGARGYSGSRIPKPLFKYRRHDTGVFQEVLGDSKGKYAQIVLNNSEVYEHEDILTAKLLLGKSSDVKLQTQPMVSVIVPTYNRPGMLVNALKSVLGQTYKNVEVIVINDAGEDIESYITPLNKEGKITYVKNSINRERSYSRNVGLKIANGKYIAYLDDDDVFYPEHLETLVKFLENSDYKVAYTDACRAHQEKENGDYVVKNRDLPYSYDFDYDLILASNFIPVLCLMHEKSCLDEIGLFDESLASHEDWDLWIRMSRKFRFRHLKKTTCEFAWRNDGSSTTSQNPADFLRTSEIMYERYKEFTKNKPHVLEIQKINLQNLRKKVHTSTDSPLVSIIIPVFNKVEYTMKCLEALASSTSYEPYEVIIVDNGSTDGTKDFLKQCLSGDVKIITNEENPGFAAARNQGARAAEGEYLVFLNNDTISQKGWLSELVKTVGCHEGVGVAGSKLLYPDGTVQHAGVVFNKYREAYHIYRGMQSNHPAVNRMREFQAVTGDCMLVSKSLFFEAGEFDEAYRNGFEDVDFCLKVKEKGHKIIYNPLSVLYHFESETPGRNDKEKENADLLIKKWGDRFVHDDEKITKEDGFRIVYDKLRHPNLVYDVEFIRELKEKEKYDMAIQALEDIKNVYDANHYIPEDERSLVLRELWDCYIHEQRLEDADRILAELGGEDAVKLKGCIRNGHGGTGI